MRCVYDTSKLITSWFFKILRETLNNWCLPKVPKQFNEETIVFSADVQVGTIRCDYAKKMNFDLSPINCTKVTSKWMLNPNVKYETIKILGENWRQPS